MAAMATLETIDQSSGGVKNSLDVGDDVCDKVRGMELRENKGKQLGIVS